MFLIFAARPVSVMISLMFSKYKFKDKIAVSWIGLRGAVPIILATIPLSSGIDNSHKLFNLVFFIVISSALIQGWTIKFITKILKISDKSDVTINSPIQFETLDNNNSELFDIIVPYNSKMDRKTIIDLNLPKDCLVVFICRNEVFFVPNGNTLIEEGDVLQILMNKNDLPLIADKLK
jgi:cell volume regulation protein A